jgi:hypothetical protein
MRSLLLLERFDLCPSNQYILVRVIPSVSNVLVPFKSPVKVQPEILYIFLGGIAYCIYGPGAHFFSCSECDMDQLGSVSFHSPSF